MSIQTMESMVQWVDDNVLAAPTLENMSAYVGYSPYYCSTKFREHIGITYKQYLAKRKLSIAMHYIVTTDHRITDIAHTCGFSSSESLSRSFMRAYHVTPSEYRKMYGRQGSSVL